jgi:hypothetical protein
VGSDANAPGHLVGGSMSVGYLKALHAMRTWAFKSSGLVVERFVQAAGYSQTGEEERAVWAAEVEALERAHLFEFPEHLGTLLTLTDNEPHPIKLPFPVIFLDVQFQVRTRNVVNNYLGILLYQKEGEAEATAYAYCDSHYDVSGTEEEMVEFHSKQAVPESLIIDVRYPVGPITFDRFKERVNIKNKEEWEKNHSSSEQGSLQYARSEFRTLNNITLNFLDLLETPDVFLVNIHKDRANARRERHGQAPLPERSVVRVRDSLRRYIYRLESGGAFNYSHAFWVRGHFMHFRSDRYMATGLQGTKKWIEPYVKGEGILIKKDYLMPGVVT